jgi:hypothetical protein
MSKVNSQFDFITLNSCGVVNCWQKLWHWAKLNISSQSSVLVSTREMTNSVLEVMDFTSGYFQNQLCDINVFHDSISDSVFVVVFDLQFPLETLRGIETVNLSSEDEVLHWILELDCAFIIIISGQFGDKLDTKGSNHFFTHTILGAMNSESIFFLRITFLLTSSTTCTWTKWDGSVTVCIEELLRTRGALEVVSTLLLTDISGTTEASVWAVWKCSWAFGKPTLGTISTVFDTFSTDTLELDGVLLGLFGKVF